MLGLDALGSAAYGPEAALTLFIPLGAAGMSLHRADQHADHRAACWSSIFRTGRRSRRIRTGAGRTRWPRRTWARRPACSPRRHSCSTTCWWWPSAFRRAWGRWSRRCRELQPYTLALCLGDPGDDHADQSAGGARVGLRVHDAHLLVHRLVAGHDRPWGGQDRRSRRDGLSRSWRRRLCRRPR